MPNQGTFSATVCGFLKMPEPMMVPITIAVAINGPSARINFPLEEDEVLMVDQSNQFPLPRRAQSSSGSMRGTTGSLWSPGRVRRLRLSIVCQAANGRFRGINEVRNQ